MELYHHYKNKPYKYVGLARHSETLEEMVIYETRYENDNGKVWVRPKGMYFESIELNGKTTPRFKKIPLAVIETTNVSDTEVSAITPIIHSALGGYDQTKFHSTLSSHKKFHLATAFIDDQAVGFKLGYEQNHQMFYSWLGGIIPEYRGIGVASDLMNCQHEWCRKAGYTKIQTKTQTRNRDMLVLNLRHGFEVIGTHDADAEGLKVIMEKSLT